MTALALCPACPPGGGPAETAGPIAHSGAETRIDLSLPAIHCAACIATVEAGLQRLPEVRQARVNLTRRMVSIRADAGEGLEDRLIAALGRLGYQAWPLDSTRLGNAADDRADRELLSRLGVAGFASMNVMLLSVANWSGTEGALRELFHWLSALIALPAVAYAGQPFFAAAWAALKAGRMTMDTPISLALILSSAVSLTETMQGGEHAYFDAAISLTFLLLAGRYLDFRTRVTARSAAAHLAALEVQRATRLDTDGSTHVVAVGTLARGDTVLVASGMKVPVDGIVATGAGEIDASLLTGETLPRGVGPGDMVHAGMVNLGASLQVTVAETGDGMLLRQIARMVDAATRAKGRAAALADRAARVYAPAVHLLALGAFVWWMMATGDLRTSVNVAVATLIITCPCALGIAVPAVLTAASGRLYRMGMLLMDGAALERLAQVDTAVFDKTGTLTTGHPALQDAAGLPPPLLALAAGLSRHSAHPLSRAITEAATAQGITPAPVEDVVEIAGQGLHGIWQGRPVRLGRDAPAGAVTGAGGTTVWLDYGAAASLPLRFTDTLRPGAAAAVADLHDLGLTTALLSGDAAPPVAATARAVGIATALAGQTPQDKVAWLTAARTSGHRTLMVGDGLNDAAAVATADVSVALASGVDVTRASADIVLTGGDLGTLGRAVRIARAARHRILENFAVAVVYNVLAIPLALSGSVTPLIAAIAMSTSSILVALNALRLPPVAERGV